MQKLYYILCFFFVVQETLAGRVQNCACGTTSDTSCDNRPYGHRRALLQTANLEWGGPLISFDREFHHIKEQAEPLFKEVIDQKLLERKEESSDPNIASFCFVFFDTNGQRSQTFYFRINPTDTNVTQPFFFFSGRRRGSFNSDNNWDALPDDTVKENDSQLYASAKETASRCSKLRPAMLNLDHISTLKAQAELLEKQLKEAFQKHSHFFTYLKLRYNEAVEKYDQLGLCTEMLRCIDPYVDEIIRKKVYFPKQLDEKTAKENKIEHKAIGYFTHSEQYALFKMGNDKAKGFRDFLKCVQVQLGGQFQVKRCAILVYTSNVMCARCAHSVVIDFERSFKNVMREALGLNTSLQQVFIAGYQSPYESNLHDIPQDGFEKFMGKHPPESPVLTPRNEDETYGYRQVTYSEESPLIYHYMISINEELRKAVSDQDIPQVKLLLSLGPSLQNRDKNKWTVLHIAAQQDSQALHQLLVAHLKRTTKPPNNWHDAFLVQNDYKDTAIHVAAYCNNFTLINVLVEDGFPLWIMNHVRGNGDNTPLHTAAARGHNSFIDAFLTLCERGFSPYDRATKNADGKTYQQM